MDVFAVLQQFEATLKNQVAQLQAAAKSAAPGGVGDWEGVVAQFGLPAQSRADRVKQAGQRGHTRGALPDEFEAVVVALARSAGQVLSQIQSWHHHAITSDPSAGARVRGIAELLERLPAEQRRAYEDSIKPKPGVAGLAGIFANASATAKLTPWADLEYDSQLTLTCPGCGSPQRTRLRFDCEYCGSSLFANDKGQS